MEWNSINAAPCQKRRRLTNVNIAATRADWPSLQTCSISRGSFLGFSPVPSPQMVQDRDHVGRYSQPSSRTADITNARLATVQSSLGTRIIGPVVLPRAQLRRGRLTELPEQTIVPPVGFPKRESVHIPGSPCQ